MKARIDYLKEKLTDESIEYFEYLKNTKNYLINDTCEEMAIKFPELKIGSNGIKMLLEGVAIMMAITELHEEKERINAQV